MMANTYRKVCILVWNVMGKLITENERFTQIFQQPEAKCHHIICLLEPHRSAGRIVTIDNGDVYHNIYLGHTDNARVGGIAIYVRQDWLERVRVMRGDEVENNDLEGLLKCLKIEGPGEGYVDVHFWPFLFPHPRSVYWRRNGIINEQNFKDRLGRCFAMRRNDGNVMVIAAGDTNCKLNMYANDPNLVNLEPTNFYPTPDEADGFSTEDYVFVQVAHRPYVRYGVGSFPIPIEIHQTDYQPRGSEDGVSNHRSIWIEADFFEAPTVVEYSSQSSVDIDSI